MKIKYAGDEWELVRHPGSWVLYRPGVKSYFCNDLSLANFKKVLKKREIANNETQQKPDHNLTL